MGSRRRSDVARSRPGSWLSRRLRPTALALAVVLLGATGCGSNVDNFVTRSGSSFELGGQPFRFVGYNLYDAAATDIYSCKPSTRLSERRLTKLLQLAHDEGGASVLRFWAYQTYTDGGRDFTGIDRVISAARKAGMKVIPVLEDGPGNCTTGQDNVAKSAYEGDTWYTTGYTKPYGSARISYRDYVRVVAQHYRDEPTILGWMMMNEAETRQRVAGDRPALADFAADVSSVIKSVDQRHLVTLGTQSNGAPGASGADFATVYATPGLDWAEVHDWGRYGADDQPMPGSVNGQLPDPTSAQCVDRAAQIACSFALAVGLGKPLVVGEAGITATDYASRRRRAEQLSAKAKAAFAAGADGYLPWHLNVADTDGYDVIAASGDPLLSSLKRVADSLGGAAGAVGPAASQPPRPRAAKTLP